MDHPTNPKYSYWIPVLVIFSVLIPFMMTPMLLQGICVLFHDTDYEFYTHLYGNAYGIHTMSYIAVPIVSMIATLLGTIALIKLSVSTWGRSFDPPRKPWAILLFLDAITKAVILCLLPFEFFIQCYYFPSTRPSGEADIFIYMELSLILIRICLLGFILVTNVIASASLARAHLNQDKEENGDYIAVELDDDIFT